MLSLWPLLLVAPWGVATSVYASVAALEPGGTPSAPAPNRDIDADTLAGWEAAGWDAPTPSAPEGTSKSTAETSTIEAENDDAPAASRSNEAWQAAGWDTPSTESAVAPAEADPSQQTDASPQAATKAQGNATGQASSRRSFAAGGAGTRRRDIQVDDVLGGSLRLLGTFLHFDDEPELFASRADAMAVTVGRILLRSTDDEHVNFEFNGFFELARAPAGGNLAGSFASAGSTESAYRTAYLGWRFWNEGSMSGQMGVDRATVKLEGGPVQIDIGRFPVNYAVTMMLTTNDFFAPFSATAVNRIYKPGVDALRISVGLRRHATIDVVGALGWEPRHANPSWNRSAAFARASIVGGGIEWAVLGGKVSQRWVAGGSMQGDLGPITVRSEFHVGVPDAEGDGHDASDLPVYGRVAGGPGINFAWQNAMIAAEYMFASDGAGRSQDYLGRAMRRYTDDLPYLGRHYVGVLAGLEVVPLLRLGVTALVSGGDGSGLAGISATYNVADESDLLFGVFVPWGRGLHSHDTAGLPVLGSEFGSSPLSVYLESRVFF